MLLLGTDGAGIDFAEGGPVKSVGAPADSAGAPWQSNNNPRPTAASVKFVRPNGWCDIFGVRS
jgi:hypothetical protein